MLSLSEKSLQVRRFFSQALLICLYVASMKITTDGFLIILGGIGWLFFQWQLFSSRPQGCQSDPSLWRSDGNSRLQRIGQTCTFGRHCEESWGTGSWLGAAKWRSTFTESLSTALCICHPSSWLHTGPDGVTNIAVHTEHPQRLSEDIESSSNSRWSRSITSFQ